MKWYRHLHGVLFASSFLPLVLSLWPFWQAILLPVVLLIPFSINEIVTERRRRLDGHLRIGRTSAIAHAYRD